MTHALPLALLLGLAATPLAARGTQELDFLRGRWDLRVTPHAEGWAGPAGEVTALCSPAQDVLSCRISAPGGDGPGASLTVRPGDDGYDVELATPDGTLRGRGRLQRPDTLIVEGELAGEPVRLWCLATPPGRRLMVYLESQPAAGAAAPIMDGMGTRVEELPAPPPGRSPGERSIILHAVVDAPPAEVFRAFVEPELANRFFGLEARIDGRVGELYEIDFLPSSHPQSRPNSSSGAHLLAREEGRRLSFEWTSPPMVAHLNTDPLPTWVDVTFTAEPGDPPGTRILLQHHGFLRGEDWDFDYEFFARGWSNILLRLQQAARRGLLE
jgi:uncharacterized protein YndB with AHSA1/START domain